MSKTKTHCTKCINVIKNVLGPHFESLLHEDVGEEKYSVLIDEATDISVIKVVGVLAKYFSLSGEVLFMFANLRKLSQCNVEGIASVLLNRLQTNGLKPENLNGNGWTTPASLQALKAESKSSFHRISLISKWFSVCVTQCSLPFLVPCCARPTALNFSCKRLIGGFHTLQQES